MNLEEVRRQVIEIIKEDIRKNNLNGRLINTNAVGKDQGKFLINGKPARIIQPFNGFNAKISLNWFKGHKNQPEIKKENFSYYVITIKGGTNNQITHYYICDYLKMIEFVLDFKADKGNDHRDHFYWRGDIHIFSYGSRPTGYFRWGDEDPKKLNRKNRFINLNNIKEILGGYIPEPTGEVKEEIRRKYGPSGESERHKKLKEYIANNPKAIGINENVKTQMEYKFPTGDRADLIFDSQKKRYIVEIEIEGYENLRVGIFQAIKYRCLAATEKGLELDDENVHAYIVAYKVNYEGIPELAYKYNVELYKFRKELAILEK